MKLSPDEQADGDYVLKSTIALIDLHIDLLGKLDEFEQKLIPLLKELRTRIKSQPVKARADLGRVSNDFQYVCKLVRGHVAEREFVAIGKKLADMGLLVPSELSPDSQKVDGILARGAITSQSEFQLVERYSKQLSERGQRAELKAVKLVLASYLKK